jgi:dihydropteroate synthase
MSSHLAYKDEPLVEGGKTYQNVSDEVSIFFGERLQRFAAAGIPAESVALDVGIGFGKSVAHNLQLLASLRGFTRWHRPLLLGVSRKSFLPKATGDNESADCLPGSLACACWGANNGMNILRTHDVTASRQALRMTEAISAAASTPDAEQLK